MPDTATIYSGSPDLDTMGGRLSRARDALGLSAAQLARRLGVQTSTISAWETDRSQPRANRLSMLAGVLNVSPSWILHGVGTAPVEDTRPEAVRALESQLDRMKQLHAEMGEIISQFEIELGSLADR
ncbi:helix-turn-helix domain-containing protein [Chelativorans sp. ZYF759]|uniref:helix-turn-helix domain-containing protein n=1 Tax=Chelativorans sp. ZYF759 TaxID=2692213 RepID=UPI00145D64C1|nr:helix-turn-helix domain-containing protein [Chelativorans sp. ZYF759]NMG38559.1 helix-turn-helix domain-containing protein [Chelativorans sp. ZYF759]